MNGLFSFRAFGEPVSIPKETFDIITFKQRIVICWEKGLSIVDPTKFVFFSSSSPSDRHADIIRCTHSLSLSAKSTMIPDFSDADINNNLPMMTLKSRCAQSKPLGIVRCDNSDELLVIYDGTRLLTRVSSLHSAS